MKKSRTDFFKDNYYGRMARAAPSFYELLGAPHHASAEALKKAYRQKAREFHPDKNPGREAEAKEQFIAVQLAYECLSDPDRREVYDEELARRRGRGGGGMAGGVRQRSHAEQRLDQDLIKAVRKGDARRCGALIEKGAWARARDAEGYAALHLAVGLGHQPVALLLLSQGADIQAKDPEGRTVLHLASHLRDYKSMALLLLEHGAPLSAVDGQGRTPLHQAAARGQCAVAQQMLAAGADVNARDEEGRTPLHHAAAAGSLETVQALLNARSNAGVCDKQGRSAMSLAMAGEHVELVQLFGRLGVRG